MKWAIIDFQAFLDSDHKYVVKELCVAPVPVKQETTFQYWTFNTPRPFRHYSRENKYLTRHYHGMNFDFGDVPYTLVIPVLEKVVNNYDPLFVKGLEKSIFLSSILDRPVYDLNAFNCIRNFPSSVSCIFHSGTEFKCAVKNCMGNRNWFLKFLHNEIERCHMIKNYQPTKETLTHWETTFSNWDLGDYCTQRVNSFLISSNISNEPLVEFFHNLLGDHA